MSIPVELRIKLYEHAIEADIAAALKVYRARHPAILYTSKTIRGEAIWTFASHMETVRSRLVQAKEQSVQEQKAILSGETEPEQRDDLEGLEAALVKQPVAWQEEVKFPRKMQLLMHMIHIELENWWRDVDGLQ